MPQPPAATNESASEALEAGRSILRSRRQLVSQGFGGGGRGAQSANNSTAAVRTGPTAASNGTSHSGGRSPGAALDGRASRLAEARRHLADVQALDADNAAVFARRARALHALVTDANNSINARDGTGYAGPDRSLREGRLAAKERELASLAAAVGALQCGEAVAARLLTAVYRRLVTEATPHLQALLAEAVEAPPRRLPLLPAPVRADWLRRPDAHDGGKKDGDDGECSGGPPLAELAEALETAVMDLDTYLSSEAAPLLERQRSRLDERVSALAAELADAEATRGRVTSALAAAGERAREAAAEESAAAARRDGAVAHQQRWVARALPLYKQRLRATAEGQRLASVAAELTAGTDAVGEAAHQLAAELADLDRRCEAQAAYNATVKGTLRRGIARQDEQSRQAAGRAEELAGLRRALRQRQQRAAAAEAEAVRSLLLAEGVEEARGQWAAVQRPELRHTLLEAERRGAAASARRARLTEELEDRRAALTAAAAATEELRRRKRGQERQLLASSGQPR